MLMKSAVNTLKVGTSFMMDSGLPSVQDRFRAQCSLRLCRAWLGYRENKERQGHCSIRRICIALTRWQLVMYDLDVSWLS